MTLEGKERDEDVVFELNFEIKAKRLIKIVEVNERIGESFINELIENCPPTAKFIDLFVLVGNHVSIVWDDH